LQQKDSKWFHPQEQNRISYDMRSCELQLSMHQLILDRKVPRGLLLLLCLGWAGRAHWRPFWRILCSPWLLLEERLRLLAMWHWRFLPHVKKLRSMLLNLHLKETDSHCRVVVPPCPPPQIGEARHRLSYWKRSRHSHPVHWFWLMSLQQLEYWKLDLEGNPRNRSPKPRIVCSRWCSSQRMGSIRKHLWWHRKTS